MRFRQCNVIHDLVDKYPDIQYISARLRKKFPTISVILSLRKKCYVIDICIRNAN